MLFPLHGWVCFLALGWTGLLLAAGFFFGCMGYARLEGRRRKVAAALQTGG